MPTHDSVIHGLIESSGAHTRPRIAVFRALHLGDMLCAVPALRALRAALPHAHISLIGLPWAAGFAARFHRYIDAHAAFPGFPGLSSEQAVDIAALPGFIAAMQNQRFDCLLQMHGNGALSNPLLMSFGAARNAGFYREGEYCPDPRSFMPWQESQHEIVRNLQLLEFLGLPSQGEELEFPLTAADWRWLQQCRHGFPAPGTYVCLHAGARLPSRRWPARCFAELADALHQAGLRVVLTGSPQETELTRAVIAAMHAPALDLTGKTDLGGFAALASQARLVVCNDTGIVHIAAAVKTPSVAVCRGGDPRRWSPLNTRRHRIVHAAEDVRGVLSAIRQVLADNPDLHRFRPVVRH